MKQALLPTTVEVLNFLQKKAPKSQISVNLSGSRRRRLYGHLTEVATGTWVIDGKCRNIEAHVSVSPTGKRLIGAKIW